MEIDIQHGPSYAIAEVTLDRDETLLAEGGSMVTTSENIQLATNRMDVKQGEEGLMGSIVGAAKQMLAGESFLINRLTAEGESGEATIAPRLTGDIEVVRMPEETDLIIQSSSFLAAEDGVALDGEWGGARSFFGGEGLFMLRATGSGQVLLNAFGGIAAYELDGEFIVDTGHIVAFESTLDFEVETFASGWISSYLSGEGLVCRFSGRGKLYVQSRSPAEFGYLLGPKLPPRES
jgi:uncharacterized protein (TIGR00266 family)